MNSPFTPGVGLEPRHLAGRAGYLEEYRQRLGLNQNQQMNTLVMGLRGVGKSVLLRHFSKVALDAGWVPIVRELSRRSNTEDEFISGLLADIALRLKGVTISRAQRHPGINRDATSVVEGFNLTHLARVFAEKPGDKGDKFMAVLQYAAEVVQQLGQKGLVIMIDEFQLLEDQNGQYCLTLVLDAISKLQSSTTTPLHAILTGLPTMMAKMVDAKPHAERLFSNNIDLGALRPSEALDAINEPLKLDGQPNRFAPDLASFIAELSEGYPYFLQYFGNEICMYFDHEPITRADFEKILPEILAQLDEQFFAHRFSNLSNKERAVTLATSGLGATFSPTQVLDAVTKRGGNVSMGTIQQYLLKLQSKNLIYKVRRGSYAYALPLCEGFLLRTLATEDPNPTIRELGQD